MFNVNHASSTYRPSKTAQPTLTKAQKLQRPTIADPEILVEADAETNGALPMTYATQANNRR